MTIGIADMTQQEQIERRQFYRVTDRALIEIKPMADISDDPDAYFSLSPSFSILREFHQLDVDSKHLLRQISDKDKSLGLYLKTLNSKLDALARGIALSTDAVDDKLLQRINLSEGGLSTPYPEAIALNTPIALKMTLIPCFTGLVLKGHIINCEPENNEFMIHIQFTHLENFSQQLIARHIIRKQSRDRQLHITPDHS